MNRTSSLKVAPTLIVGFGGTGALALQYVKRKIRMRLQQPPYSYETPLPAKVPFIEYLVLDTTPLEEHLEDMLGDEFINLGHVNISRIADKFRADPHSEYGVLNWFPFNDLDPGQIDAGAQGVRHIGRLCFFLRKAEIESTLRSKIDSITNYAEVDRSLKNHYANISLETNSTINVHIVTSMCGGTGSGCLLDAAYLIKQVVSDKLQQNVGLTAHLVTVEPFESEQGIARTIIDYIHYNFAMTLSEVEHFTSSRRGWEVKYLDQSVVRSKDKPFSFIYLLGNKRGESLNKRQVCEMIGETVTLKSVFSEANDLKGKLDNMKAYVLNSEDGSGKRNSYSSYNIRLLSAQPDEVLMESAISLAQRAVVAALSGKPVTPDGAGAPGEVSKTYEEFEESVFYTLTGIKDINPSAIREFVQKNTEVDAGDFSAAKGHIARIKGWTEAGRKKSQIAASTKMDMVYRREKKSAEAKWQRKQAQLVAGLDSLKEGVDKSINRWLKNGLGIVCVQRLLDLIAARLKEVGDSVSSFENECLSEANLQRNLMDNAVGQGSAIEFAQAAARRVSAELRQPALNDLAVKLNELREYVKIRSEWCRRAQGWMDGAVNDLHDKQVSENSYTRRSIWTRESISEEIESKKGMFVRQFIEALEARFHPFNEEISRSVCFLPHLDPKQTDLQWELSAILRNTVHKVLFGLVNLKSFPFDSRDSGSRFPTLLPGNIHQFVEMASPVWQLEPGGDMVTNIGMTNWLEHSETGQILRNKSKDIRFTSNGGGFKEVFVFRSEHGISINRLSSLDKCIGAVRRRLALKGKLAVNELCLDPAWNIQDPLPMESTEHLFLIFSLANMTGLIDNNSQEYYFFDSTKRKIILSRPEGEENIARRSNAFVQFRRLRYEDDSSVDWLIGQIKERLNKAITIERIPEDERATMTKEEIFAKETMYIIGYHAEVARHRNILLQDSRIQKEREKQQFESEIEALDVLIDDLARKIDEEKHRY
jgi:hypothetical protein